MIHWRISRHKPICSLGIPRLNVFLYSEGSDAYLGTGSSSSVLSYAASRCCVVNTDTIWFDCVQQIMKDSTFDGEFGGHLMRYCPFAAELRWKMTVCVTLAYGIVHITCDIECCRILQNVLSE